MVMKMFGSKKELQKEVQPIQPKLDPSNRDQIREVEKEFKRKLQKEIREIDRSNLRNDMQQKKCEADLRKALKETNDRSVHALYAKQIAQCRRMRQRLFNNKTKMTGMMYSITNLFTNMKMAKMMGDTSEIIKQMGSLMNVKELTATMKDMQKTMMQFGLMNEMVDDALSGMDDEIDVDMDDKELDQIIDSVKNPEKHKQNNPSMGLPSDFNKDNELDDLQKQLEKMA